MTEKKRTEEKQAKKPVARAMAKLQTAYEKWLKKLRGLHNQKRYLKILNF